MSARTTVTRWSGAGISLLLLWGLSGCATEPATSTPQDPGTTLAATDPAPSADAWRTADLVNNDCAADVRTLDGIATETFSGDDFDRVTFFITGPVPCYRIGLELEPTQDGTGEQIELYNYQGLRVELMGFEPGDFEPNESRQSHGGDRPVSDVVFSSLYEQSATSYIGVPQDAEFAVQTLTNPTRVIVNVRHAQAGD